jgi:RNA polymerase sigma-70 factor (ECF subfamily)
MAGHDLELAKRVSRNDREAAEELAGRLFERVRAACRYLAGGHSDWEDLVQNVMIEILKSTGSYGGEAPLEAWAQTIVMRTLWRMVRKRERYSMLLSAFRDVENERAAGSAAPERGADTVRLRTGIARCLDRIHYAQRTCLVMKFVYGYSVKEIAELTDTPENTVKDRIKKGKEKLRRLMAGDRVVQEFRDRGES